MLEVKNVSKQYRGEDKLLFDAVSDVSLSMEDHCIYALVGESGCGKSTLAHLCGKGVQHPFRLHGHSGISGHLFLFPDCGNCRFDFS